MLTARQIAQFEQQGLIRLPQTVPAAIAAVMRDRLWGFLSAMHGRQRDKPATWTPIDARTGFKMLMRTGAFDILGDYLGEPITDLLQTGGWNPPAHWGHPLITFPNPGCSWAVPSSGWHVDSTRWSAERECPGIVAFTFLDEVRPRGGGTLVMPGSHRLTWQLCRRVGGFMRTSEMKATLAAECPWFADLWRESTTDPDELRRYFHDGVAIEGTHVHLAELCGQPGDIVLMNQRILHVAAPNALDTPRMMLADFIT